MEINFFNSKSGEKTCTVNSKYLHSKYSPVTEAEKFVNSIPEITPDLIILVSPGLPYCYNKLKTRFPNVKIAAINFDIQFSNTLWDYEWVPNGEISLNSFLSELFICFDLKKIHIETWYPSLNIWPVEIQKIQNLIKELVNRETAVNITRKYFGKRWFKNIIRNIFFISKTIYLKTKIENPVLIAAAGQSLEDKERLLKSGYFFKIAVTSASGFLCNNSLLPDLFFITDGGYWAKEHFIPMYFAKEGINFFLQNMNLAISMEAAIPGVILENTNILPMSYNSPFTESLLKINNIKYMKAKENGTVAGSAVEFALEYSNKNIYLAGLDLGPGKNSFHARPGVQETRNRNETLRTNSLMENIPLHSGQMEIYKNWFENIPAEKKQKLAIITPSPVQIQSIKKIPQDELIMGIKPESILKNNDLFYHSETLNDKRLNTVNYLKKIISNIKKYTISDYYNDDFFSNIISYIDWDNYRAMESDLKNKSQTKADEVLENIKINCIDFISKEIKRYDNHEFL